MSAQLPPYTIVNSPTPRSRTLVIVPVYNEMPHLRAVIQTIRACWDGDILAVDDHSTDISLCLLRAFDSLHIIHNHANAGAGGVLLQGFRFARERGYSSVITLDSDGQHFPFCIRDFLHEIEPCERQAGHQAGLRSGDFVWGSRYMFGYPRLANSFQGRQEVNKIITRRLNAATGYRLTDAFCGFRAYCLGALAQLDLSETGYGMFLQMTVQATRAGISIRELPVPVIYLDETRNFHRQFRDTQKRLAYYLGVIDKEVARGKRTVNSSE